MNFSVAPLFSDNMVLQRNKNVRVFGECSEDCADITVSVPELDITVSGICSNGRWEALLPSMKACEKCSLAVSSGQEKILFSNVAVGEVWLAGGQSNMEFELRHEKHGAEALRECANENVRFYYTPKCEMVDNKLENAFRQSGWNLPGEENAVSWSAVGYYFAKALSRRLGVTVGIIGCNWGGTSASAWMKREYLSRDSRISSYSEDYDKAVEGKTTAQMIAEYDEYVEYHTAWEQKMQKCYAQRPDIKWDEVLKICGENRYPGPMGCKNPMRPCGLYETMISRVAPYTIAGFIYYQGESDDHRPEVYDVLLRNLIENWREDWKDDTLPFMLVQLPMFKFEADPDYKHWAKIREAQMKVYTTVKNTGIAVALDCGEFNNIHPTDKTQVGYRLYLQAMYHVYGDSNKMKAFPPVYRDYRVCKDKIVLCFDNCDGFDVRGELNGFEIAGADGVFCSAEAEIKENIIEIRSDKVIAPVQARFKWTNYAEVELFGKNGIPVPPFRTHKEMN
ncbi:MAG: sialate O-acetylesterase [Ruminococcus sp.]|nr:sialate O-acetylesterase [Ruminococcus sp.]